MPRHTATASSPVNHPPHAMTLSTFISRGAPTGTPTRLPRWGPRPLAPRRSLAGPHRPAPLAALVTVYRLPFTVSSQKNRTFAPIAPNAPNAPNAPIAPSV